MKLGALQQLAKAFPDFQPAQAQEQLQKYLLEMGLNPNMLYQELEMTSPYVDTHRDTSYSNAHMQLHSHTFFELLYCCNSCGAEYLVGSERYCEEAEKKAHQKRTYQAEQSGDEHCQSGVERFGGGKALLINESADNTADTADIHNAGDTEIHVAGFLGDDLAR